MTRITVTEQLLREMFIEKMGLLGTPANQKILRYKFNQEYHTLDEKNAALARLLIFNSRYQQPEHYDYNMAKLYRKGIKEGEWLPELNAAIGTTLTIGMLFEFRKSEELLGYTYFSNYKQKETQWKEERSNLELLKKLPKGYSMQEFEIAMSGDTFVATSFDEFYGIITDPSNGFAGRYNKDNDGVLLINMSDIPVAVVRSKNGLQAFDESQPLVYILFGPTCDKSQYEYFMRYAKKYVVENIISKEYPTLKKQLKVELDYQKMSPCGLPYWMRNPERRYYSDITDMESAMDKVMDQNGILLVSEYGWVKYEDAEFESQWEDDPSVNSGNIRTVSSNVEY